MAPVLAKGDWHHQRLASTNAHPEVRVQVGTAAFPAWARTADPEERETYWEAMTALWPLFDDHQAAARPRELPLVIIEG